jgi:hypothetical protein
MQSTLQSLHHQSEMLEMVDGLYHEMALLLGLFLQIKLNFQIYLFVKLFKVTASMLFLRINTKITQLATRSTR